MKRDEKDINKKKSKPHEPGHPDDSSKPRFSLTQEDEEDTNDSFPRVQSKFNLDMDDDSEEEKGIRSTKSCYDADEDTRDSFPALAKPKFSLTQEDEDETTNDSFPSNATMKSKPRFNLDMEVDESETEERKAVKDEDSFDSFPSTRGKASAFELDMQDDHLDENNLKTRKGKSKKKEQKKNKPKFDLSESSDSSEDEDEDEDDDIYSEPLSKKRGQKQDAQKPKKRKFL